MEIKEVSGGFHDILVVTEMRGHYPQVPTSADVDYDALVAGDPAPQFLTIPIGKAGVTSRNKRHYDDAFVKELERQTLALKPVGLMGHLSDAERSTAFPPEAILWVGAVREGDVLWGKGYLPPGPTRERIVRYKASGKSLATSIDAHADGKWDESLGAYRMDARTLRLGQIDLAPADRAGVPDLAAVPQLTKEMTPAASSQAQQAAATTTPAAAPATVGGSGNEEKHMTEKTKLEVITEMSAEDARLLPTVVRDAVLATAAVPPEVTQMQELRTTLDLAADSSLLETVKSMKQEIEQGRNAAVQNRIRELVEDKEKGIKVEAVKGLVSELVAARRPRTVQEAEQAFSEVVALDSVKNALALSVQNTMGPSQRNPVASQNGKATYFPIPVEDGKEPA